MLTRIGIVFIISEILFCFSCPASSKEQSVTINGNTFTILLDDSQSIRVFSGKNNVATNNDALFMYGSLYSYADFSLDGGLSIFLESDASRTKYKTITPISDIHDGNFFINCSYIFSRDSLSGELSLGKVCSKEQRPLSRASLESSISDKHLISYSNNPEWIDEIPIDLPSCQNSSGLTYGDYRVLRCNSGESAEVTSGISILIFNNEMKPLLHIDGYDFVPSSNYNDFSLVGVSKDAGHIIIESSMNCLSNNNSEQNAIKGVAEIGNSYKITYSVFENNECFSGEYMYDKYKTPINVVGSRKVKYYLLEKSGSTPKISGVFILSDLSSNNVSGLWLSAPNEKPLRVESTLSDR